MSASFFKLLKMELQYSDCMFNDNVIVTKVNFFNLHHTKFLLSSSVNCCLPIFRFLIYAAHITSITNVKTKLKEA
jgi:hypothetical protein